MVKKISWIVAVTIVVGGFAYPKLKSFYPDVFTNAGQTTEASLNQDKPIHGKSIQNKSIQDKSNQDKSNQNSANSQNPSKASNRNFNALQVSVYKVEPIDFVETITSSGTVRADEGVELQAETNGKVININFQEGMPVKKGSLLVKLNDSDLRANLERYKYNKELSELRFRRIAQLLQQNVVTQDDYDTALNEVKVQESFIDLYQAQIEKTEIRAPFDGVVGLRFVSVGAYVNANTRIATLQQLDELKIDFSIPERYSGRINVGGKIQFTVAGGLKSYQGKIFAIDPRIDTGTRTLLVRAVCANTDSSLLPGAFTNVSVELEKFPNAVLIPAEAVIPSLDKKIVYGMRNGVAEMRAVETGMRTSTQVHILSGLQAGDVVITSGLQQMQEGLPVEPLQGLETTIKTIPPDTMSPQTMPHSTVDMPVAPFHSLLTAVDGNSHSMSSMLHWSAR